MKRKVRLYPAILLLALVPGPLLARQPASTQAVQEEDAAALKTALTEVEAGRMYEGLRQLKQLLRHNPNYPHTYFYLARIYGQMGQKETALRYLGKAIELEPQQGAYYNLVGAFLLQQEKFQGALEQFQKALARTPEKEKDKAWRNIGLAHQELSQWEEAIRAFEKAVQLQPQEAGSRVSLGTLYLKRNRLEEAARELATAVQLDAELAEAKAWLGRAYSRAGRPQQALEAFRQAIALDPQHQMAHYNLAQTLAKLGRREEAQKALVEFQTVQKQAREREHRRFAIGGTFQVALRKVEEEKFEEATELLPQMLAVEPQFVPALYNLGFAFLKQAKYEQAIASLQKAVQLDPLNAGAYFYLGAAYVKTGQLAEALETTERALVIHEEDAKYHNQLGEIHLALNQGQAAERAFEQALELDGKFFPAHLNLGSLLLGEGKLEAALRHLEAALELDRSNAEAHRLLGLAYREARQEP